MIKKILNYFKIKSFNTYWNNYGGFNAIWASPYFKISLLLSAIINTFGSYDKWFDLPLSILPNLLGFSIGAYAVVLVLGNGDFWKFIAEYSKDNLFMNINSSFIHFIFVQVTAILFALLSKGLSLEHYIASFFGILLLIYAILTAFAASMAILELSKHYQNFLRK
jgi:hypothetical protein